MRATELFDVIHYKTIYGETLEYKEINTLVNDTRKINKNSCFIAIRGEHFDGHDAIELAVEKGATVIVVDTFDKSWSSLPVSIVLVDDTLRAQAVLSNQFYGQPSTKLSVVAITGTNGKTTTSSMISDWLNKLNHKTGLLGTLHYKVDQTYYSAINTTPNALELQRLFAEMVTANCDDAIIEASSHALQLGRLWFTDVDCAIFTNLTREHLDFHHTMENYAYAKSLLFSQLGQRFVNNNPRIAIVNQDDAYYKTMSQATSAEIITYSIKSENATIYATNIMQGNSTTHFILHDAGQSYSIQLKMLGEYNVSNYLAAYACLKYYYNVESAEIIEVADQFTGVEGRMQMIDKGQSYQVVVDFAHTPDAIDNVLNELSAHKTGRLITLIGHSGGNRDSGARPEIGNLVFKYSDFIVFTADNPRHESVQKICQELIGQHDEVPFVVIEDRVVAVEYALSIAEEGDTVVFTGKGGETYQVIGDEYIDYHEAKLIEQILDRNKEEHKWK